MIGNLLIYLGPEALNDYGEFLREFLHGGGSGSRGRCCSSRVALHIWAATVAHARRPCGAPGGLSRARCRASPPTRRARCAGAGRDPRSSSSTTCCTSRSARSTRASWTATCTTTSWRASRSCRWRLFYIVAMVLLGLHLYHGVWSMLQTLGLSHPRYEPPAPRASPPSSPPLVVGGNISFPLAVLTGRREVEPEAPAHGARIERSRRRPREEVGEAPLRHEAGEPRQQAQVHRHRRRLGPGRRVAPRPRWPSWATT